MILDTLEVHSNLRIYLYIQRNYFFKPLYLSESYSSCNQKWLWPWMMTIYLNKIVQSYDKKSELKPTQCEAIMNLGHRKED